MKRALLGLILTMLVVGGCRKEPPQTTNTTTAPVPQTTAKPAPAVTLTLAFQSGDPSAKETQEAAAELTKHLAEVTGYAIEPAFDDNYADAILALKSKKADVVLLSGWAYLKAHHTADADLLLAEERDGASSFEAQWFVAADSKLQKVSDLKKKRIAFSSPTSAPGFLLPYAKLIEEGVVKSGSDLQKEFAEVYFTGAEAQALRVLIDGKVDAAAGPSFGPTLFLSEEDRPKVRAIATIPGAPTSVLAVRSDMDMQVRDKIKEALLALNEGKGALLQGAFGIQKLVARSHGDHVTTLQNAQELVGTDYLMPEEPEPAPAPAGLQDPPD